MFFHKEIIDNQFFLHINGKLIYKKWFSNGYSLVFDKMPYDKHTFCSIVEETRPGGVVKVVQIFNNK